MKKLIEKLKDETNDLKHLYIEKCKEYANKEFDTFEMILNLEFYDKYKYFGIDCEEKRSHNGVVIPFDRYHLYTDYKSYMSPKVSEYRNGKVDKMNRSLIKYKKILEYGKNSYILKSEENAISHYNNSIVKLANRIVKKGLDINNITMLTESKMEKGNISTYITDSNGLCIHAYTILAWGEINKPHYRYLIK